MSEQTKNSVLSGAKLRAKRELVGLTVEELFADVARTDAPAIVLPYYRDQAEFDKYSRDKGCYSFANAVTRACLAAFEDFGVPTRLYYPAEDEELHAMATKSRTMGDTE